MLMPFDISKVKFHEKYINAVWECIKREGELNSLYIDNEFFLEFGDSSAIHIVYLGVCDLCILMEPENDGWTATRVCVDRTEGNESIYSDMTFLFTIPNTMADDPAVFNQDKELCRWMERAKVYKD